MNQAKLLNSHWYFKPDFAEADITNVPARNMRLCLKQANGRTIASDTFGPHQSAPGRSSSAS